MNSQNKRDGSDVIQVESGMLIIPHPNIPAAVWEIAETEEMKEVISLYGKTYHFWQVDRDDILPFGKPGLMMSFTKEEQVRFAKISYLVQGHCSKIIEVVMLIEIQLLWEKR